MNATLKPSDEKETKRSSLSINTLLASAVAAIAIIGTVMMLAGFGVALALETELGIPHATVFKSSFDLLELSVWFESWVISNATVLLKELVFSYEQWRIVSIVFLITIVTMPVAFILAHLYRRHVKTQVENALRKVIKRGKGTELLLLSGIAGSIVGLVTFIAAPLLLSLAILATSLLAVIPLTSHKAGVHYIQKYVIEPEHCAPTRAREARTTPKKELQNDQQSAKRTVATCLRIIDGGKMVAEGRAVFGTSSLIVLYDPNTGKVIRESLDGKSIEVVSQLSSE